MMPLSSIPLAFVAGMIGLMSPCVLPLLPAVIASATRANRFGLFYLTLGLSLSLAASGTILTFLLLNAGLPPNTLRDITAVILIVMGGCLLFHNLSEKLAFAISRVLTMLPSATPVNATGNVSQLMVGISLGLVWLPCVGPTIGTAIALASQGQDMGLAFTIMLAYGLGTALPLAIVGGLARHSVKLPSHAANLMRKLLGLSLLLLGIFILTGLDHQLEILSMRWLPDWALDI